MVDASLAQLRSTVNGWLKTLCIDDHEFFALSRIDEMHETHPHSVVAPVAMRSKQGVEVSVIRTRFRPLESRCNTRIYLEIQSTDNGVTAAVAHQSTSAAISDAPLGFQ